MTSNQMMGYYVRPRHIHSHNRTCTHSNFCRRPSSLVEFHICYILDHASIHEISILMIMILVFPMYIIYLHPLWRSWFIVYCTWQWPHMTLYISCLFMAIVFLFIQDCYMYLLSHVEIEYCIIMMSGWFFHLGLHYSTFGLDIMYFNHPHIRGNLL